MGAAYVGYKRKKIQRCVKRVHTHTIVQNFTPAESRLIRTYRVVVCVPQ